jgi:hypothetical protein
MPSCGHSMNLWCPVRNCYARSINWSISYDNIGAPASPMPGTIVLYSTQHLAHLEFETPLRVTKWIILEWPTHLRTVVGRLSILVPPMPISLPEIAFYADAGNCILRQKLQLETLHEVELYIVGGQQPLIMMVRARSPHIVRIEWIWWKNICFHTH